MNRSCGRAHEPLSGLDPARPRSPRDKVIVEVAVQLAERWILARLRNVLCFSLAELNAHIRMLLEELNRRPMRVYKKSPARAI